MNELQVRLTADISQLQASLKKAKQALKDFEETGQSPKSDTPFKRKIGLIEQLTIKAKALRVALDQATNEQKIESYNKELQNTVTELTRLNSLGRSVSANLGATSGGFNKLGNSVGNANGVALEFNRIIQDAPFGLIGIGNNIQQLTANFAQLKEGGQSTGAVIKASLSALISPANLLVLGISAVTAGFTAYQMGAFDGLLTTKDFAKEAEEAAKALEDYKNSLDSVTKAGLEGSIEAQKEIQSFSLLKAQLESNTTSRKKKLEAIKALKSQYPDYLGNISDEKFLVGDVGDAYQKLTNSLLETAKARAASNIIVKNTEEVLILQKQQIDNEQAIIDARDKVSRLESSAQTSATNALAINGQITAQNTDLVRAKEELNDLLEPQIERGNQINKLTNDNLNLNNQINQTIKQGATFTEASIEKTKEKGKEEVKTWSETEDAIIKAIQAKNRFNETTDTQKQFDKATSRLTGKEGEDEKAIATTELENDIALSLENMGLPVDEYVESADKIKETNNVLLDSFGALGTAIASNLNISSDALKGFVTTLLSNAPKIISAIIAQAQASNKAADIANKGNLKQAIGNSVVTATNTAKSLGPIGLAALPVLIGGALALVTSAFGKGGGGGGSGGVSAGSSSGAPPQMFTNVNTVQPPTPTSPNYSGGSIDFNNAQSRMTVDIDGDKLKFIVDRANERKQAGG